MENKITKEFLREYFSKHDTLTLYKPDGTPSPSPRRGIMRWLVAIPPLPSRTMTR